MKKKIDTDKVKKEAAAAAVLACFGKKCKNIGVNSTTDPNLLLTLFKLYLKG